MKRAPIFSTLVVTAAVVTMLGLGVWQWQRAKWKERLLTEYSRAAALPALDLDPLLARGVDSLPPLAFRRVLVTCRVHDVEPDLRGGRSREEVGGYSYFVPCRPGAGGLGGRLRVNAGWTRLPDDGQRVTLDGLIAGTLGAVEPGEPITLTSAAAPAPLVPSAPPSIDDIPNNHLFYAFQWFFFAAAALVIYALALRRRLSRGPQAPRSARP